MRKGELSVNNSIFLIQKDIILLRKFLLLLIPYFIFMAFMNLDSYSLFAAMPSMLLLISSCNMDTQQMNQRFLINLPVRRQELVRAKYISVLPYALFGLAATSLIYLVTSMIGTEVNPDYWKEVGVTMATFPILASIYLPLHYWLGAKGAQVVNLAFMFILLFGANSIQSLIGWLPTLTGWMKFGAESNMVPYIILAVAYVFVISCSYIISLRIYERKDV